MNEIHRLEGEVEQARAGVKAVIEQRTSLIEALPEYQALEEARAAVEAAKAKLKIAVRDNRDLAKLDVEIAEADSICATSARSCRTRSSYTRSSRQGCHQGARPDPPDRAPSTHQQTLTRPGAPTVGRPQQVPGSALPDPRGYEGRG